MRIKRKALGRSRLARVAHFKSGAGLHGGSRREVARRKRRQDRAEAREALRPKPSPEDA